MQYSVRLGCRVCKCVGVSKSWTVGCVWYRLRMCSNVSKSRAIMCVTYSTDWTVLYSTASGRERL